ncbi:AAA domain-containing protein [Mycobacterium colombiense]|uniref:AAA domain-containing protein n=1 Tax=Mycobacterium colombiense TaxID=339268 RepID=UPI000B321317|nr:AAA domain-containing protein [Mycobacterium colombiense]
MTETEETVEGRLLRKAINLFTFLGRSQQLLVKPVRTADKYEKVMWFGELPDNPAIQSAHRAASPNVEAPLLAVDRIGKLDPPEPPERLRQWLTSEIDDIDQPPTLREAIYVEQPGETGGDSGDEPDVEIHRIELGNAPEITELFESWLTDWQLWADRERRDAAVRDVYKELFAIHLSSTDHSEEFELVLGVGCLSWRPPDHEQVRRHVTTVPVSIGFDESTGTLTVTQVPAPEAVSIELDMLDPALIATPAKIDEIRQLAAEYEGHVLDKTGMGDVCRRLIHRLDADAEYDDEGLDPPSTTSPRGAYAPALILRRRTNRGLVQIYESIVAQLRAASEVPSGILPLIDPDRQPTDEANSLPGAVVAVGDEDFLPLPVNEAQRRIISRVDHSAQTVVQGPPGTGKTHTAAALVSHLLAKGMRVLITAHTDRALQEVRAKLPREIQSLAVSVIGQSRSDMADLRTAVDNISRRADEFDMADSAKAIDKHLAIIDDLRRQRAETYGRLITIRRQEVEKRDDGPEEGTLAAIAYRHLEQEPDFAWIREFDIDRTGSGQTVPAEDIRRWRVLLSDHDLLDNEDEASRRLPDPSTLPSPAEFGALVDTELLANQKRDGYQNLLVHDSFEFVRSLAPQVRQELRARVSELADRATELERREESWMNDALHDVRAGRQQLWLARSAQLKQLADQASALIQRFGPTTTITIADGDIAVHQQIARSLIAHLDSGNKLKVLPDGSPKIGAFAAKVVKAAEPFFTQVKLNGLPVVTREQLGHFVDWVETDRLVSAMDHAWPVNVVIPDEDTFDEKVQWHRTEVAQLDKVLALGDQIQVERAWFERNDLPVPDWNNLDAIRRYSKLVEAAAAADAAVTSRAPIDDLLQRLKSHEQLGNHSSVTADFCTAVEKRDVATYVAAHNRLTQLHAVSHAVAERDRIRAGLDRLAPRLAEAIAAEPSNTIWDIRLERLEQAWRWEMTGRWLLAQDSEDSNALKVRLNALEQQIRSEVEHLAAERAWQHAVAPGRLTGAARANLTQYAQLVASLGKGTGKYAAKKRVEIAEAMDRCRPSVPVWIMPIYRIAEQMRVQPNLFDVVIVDEASQAGLEASFLQYLAPKIVVIGDDKQVSPSAVGVDQQQLRDLANLYLADDTYIASWLDPKRSYFDEANMRFGGRITLTEHRRCVPEIIGFSNRIAYEPEGIRLVPVRQFGAERLEPIKVVHVVDGFELDNKTNQVEADAIIDQIRKCLADPQYDGATIGVISLLGKEQARLIEHKLLDAVPPEEWTARELRCGDASDFQGSERDVMFLSMVKAPTADRRLSALTSVQYVQRFNVAASRAKDQMWVYHSMPREALSNTEDMRYQLLDYCYGVVNRSRNELEAPVPGSIPEDVLVPPFDSLFEQRIFNRIIDRGYTVIPQYPALGYNIDLVVVGAKTRLAVECDGDFWHGPSQYEADLARQRELERCGWEFFRVRESVFYAEMPGSLQRLWETLDELDIRTADWIDQELDDASEDEDLDDWVDEESLADTAWPAVQHASETLGGHELTHDLNADFAMSFEQDAEQSAGLQGTPDLPVGDLAAAAPVGLLLADPPLDIATSEQSDQSDIDLEPKQRKTGFLAPYVAFEGALPTIGETPLTSLAANIVRIVETEGPMLGSRLHQVYVRSAGGLRVGKEIARVLNRAITTAERRGLISSDNPLNESGIKPRTFRTPTQPKVSPRELGPRILETVPPAELAHHLADLAASDGSMSEEELFRAVLDLLGLKRLTDNARAVLSSAMTLVELENKR